MSSQNLNKDFVSSLDKGLRVIRAFSESDPQLTLSEMAKKLDMSRATSRRFLMTLNTLGYVETDGKLFWLSPKILELGYAYLTSRPLVNIVQPFIEQVSKATGESCSVSVIEQGDIVYIARYSVNHIMSINLQTGSRLPAWITSMGRVLLAYLPPEKRAHLLATAVIEPRTGNTVKTLSALDEILLEVRQQGYCVVNQELEEGLISIAVPIFNKKQEVIAAINIGAASARLDNPDVVKKVLAQLTKASQQITQALSA